LKVGPTPALYKTEHTPGMLTFDSNMKDTETNESAPRQVEHQPGWFSMQLKLAFSAGVTHVFICDITSTIYFGK